MVSISSNKNAFARKSEGYWLFFIPLSFVSAIYIVWQILSPVNFLYSTWYEVGDFQSFIDYYAPQNKHKKDFAKTTREERIRLFALVNKSINGKPELLEKITYHEPSGKEIDFLFHEREVEHLFYVSKLVTLLKKIGLFSTTLTFFLVLGLYKIRFQKPSLAFILAIYGSLALCALLAFLIIGPLNVFTLLHEWAFPPGHQWFFYYQDSLMTTLMKAPDLFAYIAASWLGLGFLVFFAWFYYFFNRCDERDTGR